MRILNTIFLFASLSFVVYLISCSSDIIEPIDTDQLREDSIAQSKIDNDSIDWYINNHDLNTLTDSIYTDSTTGVRFAVLSAGNGQLADFNEIVSVHYIGKFINNKVFDTSKRPLAIESDSLKYVEALANNDTTFQDILDYTELDFEELLDSLFSANNDVSNVIFSTNKTFQPITFNHSSDGDGINGFIAGFRVGLNGLMNISDASGKQRFELGGRAIIFIPSAVGYGTVGNVVDPDLEDNIPPNTAIIFEFDMVNIRG